MLRETQYNRSQVSHKLSIKFGQTDKKVVFTILGEKTFIIDDKLTGLIAFSNNHQLSTVLVGLMSIIRQLPSEIVTPWDLFITSETTKFNSK